MSSGQVKVLYPPNGDDGLIIIGNVTKVEASNPTNLPSGYFAGLPAGLSINPVTFIIEGEPTIAGKFMFTLKAFGEGTIGYVVDGLVIEIEKAAGSGIIAPAANDDGEIYNQRYSTSFVIKEAGLDTKTGQKIEYAWSTDPNQDPDSLTNWQTGTTFKGLKSDTTYYIFARSQESPDYQAGTPKPIGHVTTLPPGNDQRNAGIFGSLGSLGMVGFIGLIVIIISIILITLTFFMTRKHRDQTK